MQQKCSICQQKFTCSIETPTTCWCTKYPPILTIDAANSCLCQNCMDSKIKEAIEQYAKEVKEGKRTNEAPSYAIGQQKMEEGIDYHIENGLLVMSSWFHLKRGKCCGSGCRHCPY